VRKDDVLVELDSEPYRVQVAIKKAAVDSAQAKLVVTEATVRSQLRARASRRFPQSLTTAAQALIEPLPDIAVDPLEGLARLAQPIVVCPALEVPI
jgi:multidrug resistance efflux pump